MESSANTSWRRWQSVFFSLFFSCVRGESKHSLVAGGQRDNRSELAKTAVGSSPKHHARDDVTRDDDDANWVRAVVRCGRVPYDYSKDSGDSAPKAPGLRPEKNNSLTSQSLHAF